MKLRNKKTGEICDIIAYKVAKQPLMEGIDYQGIETLNALIDEWEEYEEPKLIYCITKYGGIEEIDLNAVEHAGNMSVMADYYRIGNYFKTKEEAEKTIEKLKAFKRLKDKGFFFDGRTRVHDNTVKIRARVGVPFLTDELTDDLDLLFGGDN